MHTQSKAQCIKLNIPETESKLGLSENSLEIF